MTVVRNHGNITGITILNVCIAWGADPAGTKYGFEDDVRDKLLCSVDLVSKYVHRFNTGRPRLVIYKRDMLTSYRQR